MHDPIHLSPAKWLAAILVRVGQIALIVAATLGLTAANAWSQTTSPTPQPASAATVGLAIALKKEELARMTSPSSPTDADCRRAKAA
jgi:hypothetical protein